MTRYRFDSLVILFSSIIVAVLSFLKITILNYQQIIIFIIIVLLVVLGWFFSPKVTKGVVRGIAEALVLFVLSLFVQLLIISSGNIYSIFLILYHLFILALSFLKNVWVAISFLICSLSALLVHTLYNPLASTQLRDDPGTALLYLASFVVIMPLAKYVSDNYHLKDQVAQLLSRRVKVGESILQNLDELVVITDKDLKVLTINESSRKTLNLEEIQIISQPLLSVFVLKDRAGVLANATTLSIDQVIEDKTSRIINGLFLYTNNRVTPYKVTIQVRPLIDLEGKVDQLSLVITESSQDTSTSVRHQELEKALETQQARLNALRLKIKGLVPRPLALEMDLLVKAEEDVLLAQELEDHPLQPEVGLVDVVELASQVTLSRQNFAQSLNVYLNIEGIDVKEQCILSLKKTGAAESMIPLSDYSVPTDKRLLLILIEKILDIAILLSSTSTNSIVKLVFKPLGDRVEMLVSVNSQVLDESASNLIFQKYYGVLGSKTNLQLGSGLEGFICKVIADRLNIQLLVLIGKNELKSSSGGEQSYSTKKEQSYISVSFLKSARQGF